MPGMERILLIKYSSSIAVLMVVPSQYDNTGMTLTPYSAVYVHGNSADAVDGDRVKFVGDCIGKVHYPRAEGAQATVWGFEGRVIELLPGQTN